jgi:hypothetical protein
MKRRGLDEDHFRPWAFERAARAAGFTVESRELHSSFRARSSVVDVLRAVEAWRLVKAARSETLFFCDDPMNGTRLERTAAR